MKKRYRLKKEIKEGLIESGMEILAIIGMIGFVYLLFLLNAIMF